MYQNEIYAGISRQEHTSCVCFVLWYTVLFKSVFHLKIHQNDFFFQICFSFLTLANQNHQIALKESINLMIFQVKHAFETHPKAEANALLNTHFLI
jgi:hypothetical protein